jgi:two-component system chemotaxis sensor kinase CheA
MEFDALWKDFLEETLPLVERVEDSFLVVERGARAGSVAPPEVVNRALGDLHTIKGNCGMMGLRDAAALVHEMEDRARNLYDRAPLPLLEPLISDLDHLRQLLLARGAPVPRKGAEPAAPEVQGRTKAPEAPPIESEAATRRELAIRVDFRKLDQMLETIGELITEYNGLLDAISVARPQLSEEHSRIDHHAERLGKLASELQGRITESRMLPLNQLFRRFTRMVRDLARQEGKLARLELRGGDVEVDKTILDALSEPLIHLLRNAVGHGIEVPEQRIRRGKSEEGTLLLAAQPSAGVVTLVLSDDGNGLDQARLRQRATEMGYPVEDLSDEEVQQFIFLPGFSTAAKISSLSGRGVGLDVVKRAIEELGGRLDVRSAAGQGTAFLLTIPLSLSLIRALLFEAGTEPFALPLANIVEILRLDDTPVETVGGRRVVRWRGILLPLQDLSSLLKTKERGSALFCVVVRDGPQLRGLLVERLLGQREVVVKPIDEILGRVPGISGVTLLGDGSIVPILDIFTLGGARRAAEVLRPEAPR